jgi:uncharacterized membrane protein
MPTDKPGWSDQRVETVLGNLLRAGVLLAAAWTLVGGIWYLIQHGAETRPDYEHFPIKRGTPSDLSAISNLALTLHSRGFIMVGVLLLIATPVARVVFSVIAFVVQRDWLYLAVTLIVLAILLYSMITGLFG